MNSQAPPPAERLNANRLKQAAKVLGVYVAMLLGFVHATAGAQEAQPDAYAVFEGRTVSDIELSAGPGANTDVFQSRIKQQQGAPFSADAIRQSVAALQQTKWFSKVDLKVEPEPSGLRITFILEPASYVGIVTFPGTGGRFLYTRLLQAVNISEQSPYFDDLLPQGQKGLEQFLRVQGYFLASVHAQAQRDDPQRIVNLVFGAQLGPHAKVGGINFEGVPSDEAEHIRRALHSIWARVKRDSLKPGQQYSPDRINQAVRYIRGYLRAEDHLAPVVRLAAANYNPRTNRADLTFQLNPGPRVSVQVSGAHLWKRTIRREIPIYEENSVDRDLVDEGERNLVSYLQGKGYFDAQVHTVYQVQPSEVSVEYQVNRGSRHQVEGVHFDGNSYFSDTRLEQAVAVKQGRVVLGYGFSRGRFSDELVRKSVESLKALYADAGFAQVSVAPKITDFEPQVDVTFQITEGDQDKVQALRIEGNPTQNRQSLSANGPLHLLPGKPFSAHLLELDRNHILATYLNLGYLNANLKSSVTPQPGNPHLVDVLYHIEEGPQGRVSDVLVLGEQVTHPSLISLIAAPEVSTGQPLSQGKFFTAEGALYNLNVFDWVSVEPRAPLSDPPQEAVLIKVHESKRYSMDVGAGLEVIPRSGNIPVGDVALPGLPPIGLGSKFTVSQKSFLGPRFSLALAKHNLRGHAETATLSTVVSRLDQSGRFTYADPRLGNTQWNSLFSFSVERSTENPLYTARLGTGSFQVERFLDAKRTKNLIWRYTFRRTDLSNLLIPDLVLPPDQHVRLSTVSVAYVRDSRDNPLDAHHGIYQTFDFGVTPTAFGSSANFVRFLGQNAFYIPLRPWLTWATDLRLGLASPFSGSIVPLSERFFSGGADSLRGFPIDGAGPQRPVNVCATPGNPATCTLISVPLGGNMLFILNTEARFPTKIIKNLGAVLFYDGGNVYSNINLRQFVDDYTNTIGLGLRYKTPVGPVRFDVGYRLTSVPGVQATQYFVTLGQSF